MGKDTVQMTVRLPTETHRKLRFLAADQNISLNEALVEIGTHKIAVKIVGDVEDESELDTLLAEVREKALDGLGLKRKWGEAAAQ